MPPIHNLTEAETVLKSYCKTKGYEKPAYRIESRNSAQLGPEQIYRYKFYTISVKVNGIRLASGDGLSKRIARKKAAMVGIQQLRLLELQNFWQFYRTALTNGGTGIGQFQIGDSFGLIPVTGTGGSGSHGHQLQIEELIVPESICAGTSTNRLAPPPEYQNQKSTKRMTSMMSNFADREDGDDNGDNDGDEVRRTRADSDMSAMLNYAVEKLKNYKIQDGEEAAAAAAAGVAASNLAEKQKVDDAKGSEYFHSEDRFDEVFYRKKRDEELREDKETREQKKHIEKAEDDFKDVIDLVMEIANMDELDHHHHHNQRHESLPDIYS